MSQNIGIILIVLLTTLSCKAQKLIADFVYILMKPLEWFFIVILYTFEQNPENRIAKQTLIHWIEKKLKTKQQLTTKAKKYTHLDSEIEVQSFN